MKDPSKVTNQDKYLGVAAKLLTTVRVSITSSKAEESLEWADHIKDICDNQLLNEINNEVDKIKGAKRHDHVRVMRELFYEWYIIRGYYKKEMSPSSKVCCKKAPLKMIKKVEYLNQHDPMTLFQIMCGGTKSCSGVLEDIKKSLGEKKKIEVKSHPSGIVVPFLMKIRSIEDSDILAIRDFDSQNLDPTILNF